MRELKVPNPSQGFCNASLAGPPLEFRSPLNFPVTLVEKNEAFQN